MKKIIGPTFVVLILVALVGCGDTNNITNNYTTEEAVSPDGGVGTTINTANTTVINNYYGYGLDGGASPALDSGAGIDSGNVPGAPDTGLAGEVQPVVGNCSVGDQVFIGHGTGQAMAGSEKGFAIAWNSNYRTPKQTDVMFQTIDRHGARFNDGGGVNTTEGSIGPVLDVATMSNSYILGATWAGSNSGYWSCDFIGSNMFTTVNQPPGYLPIGGSENEYFAFMNNGSLAPALNKLQLGAGFFTTENSYQWGPSGAKVITATKAVRFDVSSWAFALVADTVTEVVVVDATGVYPMTLIDTANIGGVVTIGSIIAVDDGYALRWSWFPSDLSRRRAFISFIPAQRPSSGKIDNTVEISSFAPWIQIIEEIAWDGKNIGYLTMNANPNPTDLSQQTGKFFLLDKQGAVLKTATVASPFHAQTNGQSVSFAAAGSVFAVAISSVTDPTVMFQAVDCGQ